MANYSAAVIGLGWMGLLYDLAQRIGDRFEIEDTDRPTPELDVHRRFHHHDHPGDEGNPTSYSEALWSRPDTELVAAADRDTKRLDAFSERYGIDAVFTDAEAMLREVKPEIVAVATNTRHRADLTCLAVECGARGIVTEKPMAHTLEEFDRMVGTCAAGRRAPELRLDHHHPSVVRGRQASAERRGHWRIAVDRGRRRRGAASELVLLLRPASRLGGRQRRRTPARIRQQRVSGAGGWPGPKAGRRCISATAPPACA